MNELIKIEEAVISSEAAVENVNTALVPVFKAELGQGEINVVSARGLHEYLGVKSRFNDWINRKIQDCYPGQNEISVINARELHESSGSRQEFSHWVKNRIERHYLQEGQDFLISTVKEGKRGRPRTEYYIPLDMAKKLLDLETSKDRRPLPDNIYLIQNTSTKSIKIGVSKDVEGRLNSLQTGHEHQLKLIYTKPVENALELESKLHRKFSSKRVRGEWFKVNPEKVIKEIEKL